MRILIYTSCFFLLLGFKGLGQSVMPDSISTIDEFELAVPLDSTVENLTDDIMLNPADTLYNHIWDHINISYHSGKFPARKDTIEIALVDKNENKFVHPYKGKVISAYRTKRRPGHTGIDIKLNLGDTVRCAFDGKVRLAKRYSGYGNLVLVRHFNGLETVYAHLSKMNVKQNQMIKAGDVIGLGGRTGRATTTHLHFETRLLGKSFDPAKCIDFQNYALVKDTFLYYSAPVVVKKTNPNPPIAAVPKPTGTTTGSTSAKPDGMEYLSDLGKMLVFPVQPERIYYSIKRGDTLSIIARKFGTTIAVLCELNQISPRKVLQIGTKLIVK